MAVIYFITHPEVVIDPAIPVPQWSLSPVGADRISKLVEKPWFHEIDEIYCSDERKARDCAAIATAERYRPVRILAELGENDRSSTGYLPKEEFELTVDQFFARPLESVRGWETAVHAQLRVTGAVERILRETERRKNVAIFAHGGVGTLYLCKLKGVEISRVDAQPDGSGNFFAFDAQTGALSHGWRPTVDLCE
jgi:broad specificity phosphatase PhoE